MTMFVILTTDLSDVHALNGLKLSRFYSTSN